MTARGFCDRELFLVILIICILSAIAVPNMLEWQTRKRTKNAMAHSRALATAIEAYYLDWETYPPMAPLASHSAYDSRRLEGRGADRLSLPVGITTPVAFVPELYPDPYAPADGLPYVYYGEQKGWIMISAGPDRDYDITDPSQVYDPTIPQPSLSLLTGPWTYDPSNGAKSSGDIWRVRQ